jgi:hypothetical protein
MFCGNCGSKIEDGAVFCGGCGAKVNDGAAPAPAVATATPVATPVATPANKTNKTVGVIAVAAVVVIIALVFILGLGGGNGGNSPKAAADKFVKGLLKSDGAAMMDAIPDEVIRKLMKESDYTKREIAKELSDMSAETFEDLNTFLGNNWSITHEVLEIEDLSKSAMKNLVDEYESEYGITISDAKKVSVKLTITSALLNDSNTSSLCVIKIGNSWYIDVFSMDNMF